MKPISQSTSAINFRGAGNVIRHVPIIATIAHRIKIRHFYKISQSSNNNNNNNNNNESNSNRNWT